MKYLVLASTCALLPGCADHRPSHVAAFSSDAVVINAITLADVPSGSAIRAAGEGSFYIVSDDAPYVYRVSSDGRTIDSIRLQHLAIALHRITKAEKPDYEAAVLTDIDGQECLVAFGSGSHGTVRDSMSIIPLSGVGSQSVYSLTAVYERIRKTAGIAVNDFNIEGAALEGDRLTLVNRGTGHLMTFSRAALLEEVMRRGPATVPTVARIDLPPTGDVPTGFSGGVFIDARRLLFCASAEATTNWYEDGDVLGSYIGLLDFSDPAQPHLVSIAALLGKDAAPIRDKVEGIDVIRGTGGTIDGVIGVVDNDDGTSKLLHIRVDGL